MHWTEYFSPLMEGAWVTIQLTIYSTIFGAILAFAAGIGKLSSNWAIKAVSVAYIEVFRGTSLLVQLFWLYFALPIAGISIGLDLRLPPVAAGVLALSLNIGAYGAEVVRGAIQSVHQDQHEAARALNFTPRQTLWNITIPQSIPEMMPSFGNLAVQNLKDTASCLPCRADPQLHPGQHHDLFDAAGDLFRHGAGAHRHHARPRNLCEPLAHGEELTHVIRI
jgi:polar amino acid transport system permease protein